MFDIVRHHRPERGPDDDPSVAIRTYVEEHREALQHAVELLSGGRGAALVARIVTDLSVMPRLSRRCRRDLEDLLAILALETIDDPESEEAARFAALDPAAPVVEEICRLTDGLRGALEQADADRRQASSARAVA